MVSLFYDVSGQFVVKYSVEATGGYEFKDGNGRFIHDFSQTLTQMCIRDRYCTGDGVGEHVAARSNGDVAQLGEHLPCEQGVESSNLFISTEIEICQDGLMAQLVRAYA